MWIFYPKTQRYELVHNPEHIARLLGEGGTEVPDPRMPVHEPEQVVEQELSQVPEHVEQEPEHEEHTSKITDISKRRRHKA